MLKVLIIDDDALTRKGIQTLMPWAGHGMEIVGEAANGKAALDFLAAHDADLALVDIDMPVMNGLTFIETAGKLYPHLNYVVLTIHTEFEYIQRVLRLGVIDYISKTHFDKENFDAILTRIKSSIMKKNARQENTPLLKWRDSKILYPDIYALVTMAAENDDHITDFFERNDLSGRSDIFEIAAGVWIFTDERSSFKFPEAFPETMLLKISDVNDLTYAQLERLLRIYKKDRFFYDYQPLAKVNHKRAYELEETPYIRSDADFKALKDEWISLNWVHENQLFDKIRFDLKSSRLTYSQLYHLLLALENVWNSSYARILGHPLSLPANFTHWGEVENWLMGVYEKINLTQTSSKYSEEIQSQVIKARHYIDNHYSEPLSATEIARSVHMSYSYFSRCFHDLAGMSFNDYCTHVRIKNARERLKLTSRPIQTIAYEVGYNDEKYFSRMFKKVTGVSPSEYRRQG